MKTSRIVVPAIVVSVIAVALASRVPEGKQSPSDAHGLNPAPAGSRAETGETTVAAGAWQGFLFGRVSTRTGATYEGRLRWGGDEEALWGQYFNGFKDENPWAALVPPEQLPKERRRIAIFGIEIADRQHPIDLGRPFMARFGDISRVEARGGDVRVILKSGTVFDLDRLEASDFDDGLRVWDETRGVVDLDSLEIRAIEFFPAAHAAHALVSSYPLHGRVRTRHGDFIGFVQWDRQDCLGTDELDGRSAEGDVSLRFETIRSIARHTHDSTIVTLLDGRETVLSGTRDAGDGHRGLYVDDQRYGRVLIAWDAFERVDFTATGSAPEGPAYSDFPPGRPLTGSVTTRAGRRLAGRLVFDLDESETTETLDAPAHGVDYTIPFGLVASILPFGGDDESVTRGAHVTLHSGEELQLERAGDLGEGNAGMLIFAGEDQPPDYVLWTDIGQVDLDRPSAMDPPAP